MLHMVEFELKKKVEAILFSAGKYVSIGDIAKYAGRSISEENILDALRELEMDFKNSDSSMMIINEGEMWKLTVRDAYMSVARKIVTQTDITKSVMETLAVIAFKSPTLQSDVIKVRTNKAYDHIRELEERGYIQRKPEGRSKRITLTQKFFDYFDLPPEQLKQRFAKVKELQDTVEYLEQAVAEKKVESKDKQDAAKKREEEIKAEHESSAEELEHAISSHPGVDISEKPGEEEMLDTYRSTETYTEQDTEDASPLKKDVEHFGNLEVIDEPPLNEEPPEGDGQAWGSLTVVKTEKRPEDTKSEETPENQNEETPEIGNPEPAIPGEEPTTITKEEVNPKQLEESKPLFDKDMPESIKAKIESRMEELIDPLKEAQREAREDEEYNETLEGKKEEEPAPSLDDLTDHKEEKPKEKEIPKESKEEDKDSEDEISQAIKDVKND